MGTSRLQRRVRGSGHRRGSDRNRTPRHPGRSAPGCGPLPRVRRHRSLGRVSAVDRATPTSEPDDVSKRLVEASSRLLESRTSRRGFLRRAAMVGTALVAAPATYVLRPGDAYSAVVNTPSTCPSGSRCRDGGWTEFCCTMTGVNTCPPGAVVGGWWRAEYPGSGTNHCNGDSRYYMDCHSADCGGCGCGGSGTCANECVDCNCTCANGDCGKWKTCCTRFRYGQCNQDIACLGPIVCRVVTCVPPWEWDSSCTKTDAVSQSTWYHDASCLHPSRTVPARPGVVTGTTWKLRNSLSGGSPQSTYEYGLP